MKPFFRLLSLAGSLLILTLVVITTAAVVARYALGAPLQWTEEMSGILMIWIVFIGAIGHHIQGQVRDRHELGAQSQSHLTGLRFRLDGREKIRVSRHG
mgnify:CR=1 FL=1